MDGRTEIAGRTRGPGRAGLRAGALAALPLLLAVAPFGFIFGVVARETGLSILQAMAMTSTVVAGASQLAALQLLADQAPALVAVGAGAVINLRMAMYSASLAPYLSGVPLGWRLVAAAVLHDQAYALSIARYRSRVEPERDRFGFYLGVGLVTASAWVTAGLAGATLGGALIGDADLSFIVPVCFIAVAAPMIRNRREAAAAATAAAVAILCMGLPFSLGLLVGTAAGLALGLALGPAER